MHKGLSSKKQAGSFETQGLKIQVTEELIDELTKSRPNQKTIKNLMSKIGLEYIDNDIDQLSKVLAYVSGLRMKSAKNLSRKEIEL